MIENINKNTKDPTVKHIILEVLKQHPYITALLVFTAAGSVFATLVPPRILQVIIDKFLVPASSSAYPGGSTKKSLYIIAAFYFGSFVIVGVLDVIRETILAMAGQKITVTLKRKMMKKISHLPSLYFTENESGEIVSRVTNDVDAIQSLFTNGIVGMIVDLFRIIGIIISMWLFSFILGIFILCILPLIYMLTRFFQKKMLSAQKRKRTIIGTVNGFVPETVRNIRMIRSFGKESYMESRYADCLQNSYDTIEKVNLYDSVFSPVIRVLSSVVIAAVAVFASAHFSFAPITAGIAAASIQYILDIFTPVGNLGMELQSIQSAVAGITRVDSFFAEAEEGKKDEASAIALLEKTKREGPPPLVFDHVTFSYGNGRLILDDVSFSVQPGQRVTFSGRTGAGKSTLFHLIPGLLVPSKGSVRIGGIDVQTIPNNLKRRIFGYVPQHFDIVRGTVADQLTLGDTEISESRIEQVLVFIGLLDYVKQLKDGLSTPMGTDLFSQGQLQLLAVARAIVSDPPVLLLDEITANLDSETEKKLLNVLEEAGRGRIVLSVSHRLSQQLSCDRLLTVENGKVTEC